MIKSTGGEPSSSWCSTWSPSGPARVTCLRWFQWTRHAGNSLAPFVTHCPCSMHAPGNSRDTAPPSVTNTCCPMKTRSSRSASTWRALRAHHLLVLGLILGGVLTGFVAVHNGSACWSSGCSGCWPSATCPPDPPLVVSYFVLTSRRSADQRLDHPQGRDDADDQGDRLSLQRDLRGRVLGYGKLTLESARQVPGAGQRRLPALPRSSSTSRYPC